jgi:hypothetical protein
VQSFFDVLDQCTISQSFDLLLQTTLVSSLLGSGAQPHLEGGTMLQDTSAATRLILGSILELHRMDQENVR